MQVYPRDSKVSITIWRLYLAIGLVTGLLCLTTAIGALVSHPKVEPKTVGGPRVINAFRDLSYANLAIGSVFFLFSVWMLVEPRVWFGIHGTYEVKPGAQDMDDLQHGYLQKIAEKYSADSFLQTQIAENIANQSAMIEDFEDDL